MTPIVLDFMHAAALFNLEHSIDVKQFGVCPVHVYAMSHIPPCHATHAGTATCKVCGAYICPECGRHEGIIILSRVTGYCSTLSSWNQGKQQEFRDRKRYALGGKP